MNWDGKTGRCAMYCDGLDDEDWLCICDCGESERCVPLSAKVAPPLFEGDDAPIFFAEEDL